MGSTITTTTNQDRNMAHDPKQLPLPEKKSQLSMANAIKLADWIKQQNLIDTNHGELAALATKAMGLRITQHNIAGVLNATGLRVTHSLSAEQQQASDIRTIATVLADMLKDLGMPIPPQLATIYEG